MKITVTKDLAPLRAAAKARVDAAAEQARLLFVTPGSAQAMVYQSKQAEALQFQLDGTVGPLLQAETGLTAPTAAELATLWLAMQAAWVQAACAIEVSRLTAKAAIDSANSPAAIDAAAQVNWTANLT